MKEHPLVEAQVTIFQVLTVVIQLSKAWLLVVAKVDLETHPVVPEVLRPEELQIR
ncbi:hypothetical protein KEU06_08240 [Pseudaminobacter sp. 19-2017]|uniref:Uncharacterized protein n=1 Tax=Pseudaminobacter soli (ex Zhang et al. 2022) TaxID=2831468 RepID=A0A942I1V7_9HYPH|nr:hypothetical protein [Pseudaminobacter soli]MBS3648617.1 hypothetical protein [Pseudaminobacter soli]